MPGVPNPPPPSATLFRDEFLLTELFLTPELLKVWDRDRPLPPLWFEFTLAI